MSTQNSAYGQNAFPFPESKPQEIQVISKTLITRNQLKSISILQDDAKTPAGFSVATLIASQKHSQSFGRMGDLLIPKVENLGQSTLVESNCSVLATTSHLADGRMKIVIKEDGNCSDLMPDQNTADGEYFEVVSPHKS